MKKIRFHSMALIDFDQSYKYYEIQSKDLAERFAFEIDKKLNEIKSYPFRARLMKGNYRFINTKTFPFQIVYSYNKTLERISIFAIHHNSKDPKKKFRKF